MIPYMVGKLAPYSAYFTRGSVKQIPKRNYFLAVSPQNGDKFVTSAPPALVERLTHTHTHVQFNKYTHTHTHTHIPLWEDQCEWYRMTRMTRPDCAVMCNLINTHTHTHTHTPWEDQREWHRMTRMTRPDCAVMCNLTKKHTHTHTHFVTSIIDPPLGGST